MSRSYSAPAVSPQQQQRIYGRLTQAQQNARDRSELFSSLEQQHLAARNSGLSIHQLPTISPTMSKVDREAAMRTLTKMGFAPSQLPAPVGSTAPAGGPAAGAQAPAPPPIPFSTPALPSQPADRALLAETRARDVAARTTPIAPLPPGDPGARAFFDKPNTPDVQPTLNNPVPARSSVDPVVAAAAGTGAVAQTQYGPVSSTRGPVTTGSVPIGSPSKNAQGIFDPGTGVARMTPEQQIIKNHPAIGQAGTQANAAFLDAVRKSRAQTGPGTESDLTKIADSVMQGITKPPVPFAGGSTPADIKAPAPIGGATAPVMFAGSDTGVAPWNSSGSNPGATPVSSAAATPPGMIGNAIANRVRNTRGSNPGEYLWNAITGQGQVAPPAAPDPTASAVNLPPIPFSGDMTKSLSMEQPPTPLGSTSMKDSPLDLFSENPEDPEFKKRLTTTASNLPGR